MLEPYHGRRGRTAAITVVTTTVLFAAGCGSKKQAALEAKDASAKTPTTDDPAEPSCKPASFAATIGLAEASGAAHIDGVGLVAVSDSDHDGAYQIIKPESGELIRSGLLPLSREFSDDLEGLSVDAQTGALVAITSSGMIYEFVHTGSAFESKRSPYPLGEAQAGCSYKSTNCGYNWEGLCLGSAAVPSLRGCIGAAASKRDGTLVCITRTDDRLTLEPTRTLVVGRTETISGCAIDSAGSIWVATNLLAANAVTMFVGERKQLYSTWAAGSIEAIAVLAGSEPAEIVLLSDTARSPSAAFRYRCTTEL